MNRNLFITTLLAAAVCLTATRTASADTYRIELDYMGSNGAHDHQPSQLILDAVIQMFACQGHTLIIELGNELPHYDQLKTDPDTDCGNFWTYDGEPDTFKSLKDDNFDHANDEDYWYYCIFAHSYEHNNTDDPPVCGPGTSSGRSDGGQNLIVTLGTFSGDVGTEYDQAATLAHEFGHCLGLSHCGTMNCNGDEDDSDFVGPRVPNMPSVMSYTYQLAGVRTRMLAFGLMPEETLMKDVDFSHGRMCTLDENNLDEVAGTTMTRVDWNCSGTIAGTVTQDINSTSGGSWCSGSGNTSTVSDYDEWANIDPGDNGGGGAGGPRGGFADFRATEEWQKERQRRQRYLDKNPCITSTRWAEVREQLGMPRGGDPPLIVESCINGKNVYLDESLGIFGSGKCTFPFGMVVNAQAASPTGSVYYFVPGTFDEPNGLVLDKEGIYLCETGTAVVR